MTTAVPDTATIEGRAAALRFENLDTDQIMPKQFLRGIDKSGLARGLLYDLRCDAQGRPRPEFVLNRAPFDRATILVAGSNFGCGSSREHAVWGLLQHGIRAIVAHSFAEIFHNNAMNNRLLLVALPADQVAALMDEADNPAAAPLRIDIATQTLRSGHGLEARFPLLSRHRRMFLEGLDSIGLTLSHQDRIQAFAQAHWARQPWLRDVARRPGRPSTGPAAP